MGVVCDAVVTRVQVPVGSEAAELGDGGALVAQGGSCMGERCETAERWGERWRSGRLRSWGSQGGRGAPTRRRSGIVVRMALGLGRLRGETGSSVAAPQRMSMSRPDLLRIRKGLEAMLDM